MKLWFKAKRYGYGWYPASWEGWLVLVGFIALCLGTFFTIMTMSLSENQAVLVFLPFMVIYTGVLLWICYKKGEEARWRWGK